MSKIPISNNSCLYYGEYNYLENIILRFFYLMKDTVEARLLKITEFIEMEIIVEKEKWKGFEIEEILIKIAFHLNLKDIFIVLLADKNTYQLIISHIYNNQNFW
ncbi:2441_t:CDS:1 [Cetraspora pellucida]|uniref:2441_t:CDS:1 n=1 Tax=Cetraspora pellucida TaxID=1433469 RepID=A0A9N8VVE7_9GLOM|nr:2441_t:CDS:1 [Cetraspora pellucida]